MAQHEAVALKGWEVSRITWCRKVGDHKAEVTRKLNPDTRLIEWHALVWEGHNRGEPLVDVFTGNDLDEAVHSADEVLT